MKKEYHRDTESTWVFFEAGRVCDDLGLGRSPMPFWNCIVVYTWIQHRHAYWVYSIQTVGFGAVEDRVRHETEMASLRDVHHLLRYYEDMETCYKGVYGE